MNEYGQTAAQLAEAEAWLERSRVWMAANGADFYPCECGECRQQELPHV